MILKKTLMTASLAGFLALAACGSPQENAAEESAESASESSESMSESMSSSASEGADFGTKASVAGLFEIETSKLAVERTKNAEVKAFAQKMITDHTKAAGELKAAITAAGMTPPAEALDEAHQNKLNDLRNATAEDFDAKYIDLQQAAHDEAVNLYKDQAENGPAGPLKDHAAKTLPVLNQHHEAIKKLDEAHQ